MVSYFFDKSKPVNYLVISLLFLVCFLLISIQEFTTVETFGNLLLHKFKVLAIFSALFLLFNFIVSKNKLTFNNTYAFLFYVILIGLFPSVITTDLHIDVTITILFLLRKIYSLKSNKAIFKKLFDAGFWLGVSFVVAPFSIVFFLLIYTAIIIHKKEGIQSLLIPIIGFIIPVFLYGTYCYWSNTIIKFEHLFYWESTFDFQTYKDLKYFTLFFLIGFFTLFSIILKTPKVFSVSNSFKKNWILLLVNFLVSILLVFLLKEKDGSELLVLFFPVSIILANGMEMIQKKWLREIILWVVLIGVFVKLLI